MVEIVTLVIDIALGGLAYRMARATAQDLRSLKADFDSLRSKVQELAEWRLSLS